MMIKKLLPLLLPLSLFAQSTATYNIEVTTIWNTAEHSWIPSFAHWSDLIGATHSTENQFMEVGQLASTGIKDVAEIGVNTAITNEINTAISNNLADQLLQDVFDPFVGNDSKAGFTNVTVDEAFPLVTLVSMVAPSPDWFIAINSVDLRSGNPSVNNGWKDTFTMDVFVYDAGTDSGADYIADNQITTPSFEPIEMATGYPTNGNRMATITFTFLSSVLSNEDFSPISVTQLYPNPVSSNEVLISNATHLKTVNIYNSLGKRVKTVAVNSGNTSYEMDVTDLRNGIYLLKLTDNEDRWANKNLVINR